MATTTSWISKKPGRCGGEACVRDTCITVWGLAAYRRLGLSDDEIRQAVVGQIGSPTADQRFRAQGSAEQRMPARPAIGRDSVCLRG
jgi:hypothetical protein